MKHKSHNLQGELESELRFEMMLAEISDGFINMPADQVSNGIQDAQRRICECLGLDRATLWQIPRDAEELDSLTHVSVYRNQPKSRTLHCIERFSVDQEEDPD